MPRLLFTFSDDNEGVFHYYVWSNPACLTMHAVCEIVHTGSYETAYNARINLVSNRAGHQYKTLQPQQSVLAGY